MIRRPFWRRAGGREMNNQIPYTFHHIYRIPTITIIYYIPIYHIPYKFRTMPNDRMSIVFRARTGKSCCLDSVVNFPTFTVGLNCTWFYATRGTEGAFTVGPNCTWPTELTSTVGPNCKWHIEFVLQLGPTVESSRPVYNWPQL